MPIDVPFSDADLVVGALEPDDRVTKGLVAPPPAPPETYVALGATTATRLTPQTAGLDPAVAEIIAGDSASRYYHVRFSCTFHPSGNATFEKAWVQSTLASDGAGDGPLALSLDPIRSDHPLDLSSSFEIGVDFKFVNAKASFDPKLTKAMIFVEALNEGLPNPGWEFTQTPSDRLSGLQRLQMIVRTGTTGCQGAITLLAQVARNEFLMGTYRAMFDQKPAITFELK